MHIFCFDISWNSHLNICLETSQHRSNGLVLMNDECFLNAFHDTARDSNDDQIVKLLLAYRSADDDRRPERGASMEINNKLIKK